MGSKNATVVSGTDKELTLTASPVCTNNPENDNAADPAEHQEQGKGTATKPTAVSLEMLAAALLTLSPTDRERLAAMLKGDNA